MELEVWTYREAFFLRHFVDEPVFTAVAFTIGRSFKQGWVPHALSTLMRGLQQHAGNKAIFPTVVPSLSFMNVNLCVL